MSTLIEMLNGLWTFLILITTTSPIGVWSFLIAAIFPAVFVPWLDGRLPQRWYPDSRHTVVETVALAVAILLAWLPWQTLNGLLVGIMAGFMSPLLSKATLALSGIFFRWLKLKLKVSP